MEKKKITGIICIPKVGDTGNAFQALNKISDMLGQFHCTISDETATLKYNGVISSEHKDELTKIAEDYNFTLIYIEMYENDERLDNNTINLINNEDI